ncbi:hypothetical protein HNO89_003105 [Sporosarcina luteola]|nr:hypothetical protein [Sporosarcina luteola]
MSPVVSIFLLILIVLPLVIYICYIAIRAMKQTQSGLKIMVLGLHLSIVGGILLLDSKLALYGTPYVLIALGLLISTYGLQKSDKVTK